MSLCYHPVRRVKNCSHIIFTALLIFLVVFLSDSTNGPVSNDGNSVVLLFWFGSYEQLRHNSHADWWSSVYVILFLCTITYIKTHNACTKILSKFQIISNFYAVKSCAHLSERPGTEFEGSIIPTNATACSETTWRTVLLRLWYFLFWSNKAIMV